MLLTDETWAETRPLLLSLLRTLNEARRIGCTVQEWRVHPVGAAILRRRTAANWSLWAVSRATNMVSGLYGTQLFGAPLIEDVTLPQRKARVLLRRTTIRVSA